MTVLQLITSSLRLIGQLGPGRSAGASETADALLVLNAMLDQWNTERLNVYRLVPATYTLTGASSYTIGPSAADWTASRPHKIEYASVDGAPVEVLTEDEWRAGWQGIWLDPSYPNATVRLRGTVTGELEIVTWTPIPQFSATTDTVALPPGYADAIRYNLAVRLAPEWSRQLRPEVVQLAAETLYAIRALNAPVVLMGADLAACPGNRITDNLI